MPKRKDIKKILVIGAGPIIIGQACEFDYSGTQACKALKDEGYKVILINSNPATIMTDPGVADKTYIEPISLEVLEEVIKKERPDAILPTMGGQTALNLAINAEKIGLLKKYKIELIGANSKAIANAEDRKKFGNILNKLNIHAPDWGTAYSIEEALEIASKIGFPLMIKAASGGGGIGMQIVHEESEFKSALRLCQGRAKSAFGDSRVFIEEYVDSAEHIEFQVLADGKRAIHFGERFCSIQRRHQKIIEEGPWISEEERQDIGSKVVAGAEAIGYRGLATFEFLRNSNGQFYFMEVNPRVQVEHTVTEMLTGVDLVSLGIIVSSGADLPLEQNDVQIQGHAIQARINAENPFTLEPSPGKIWECHWPGGPGIRVDTHGFSGYEMPEAFDSLLAKIICWAPDRERAIARLDSALEETILLGVDSLIPLHRAILVDEDFMERKITTDYLETHADLLIGGG